MEINRLHDSSLKTSDLKRVSRLTAIVTQLQTKRLLTATELAEKFSVSVRTIYRDMQALEDAGIPIYVEEGKGYKIVENYRLAPVMFTEREANALIVAEQLVLNNKDSSLITDYSAAIDKIKSVLNKTTQDKANLLSERTQFNQIRNIERTSSNLSALQLALTNFFLTKIDYTNEANKTTSRIIEPFALLNTRDNWLLVAWCRLRKEFRYFRLDRIGALELLPETFNPHNMTLQEFFERHHQK